MFATQGYEAMSVREIARVAGVDQSSIAHRFGSKEGLWIAVVEQLSEQLGPLINVTKQLQLVRQASRERIRRALMFFIDMVAEDRYIGMFFWAATTEHGERLDILLERLMRPYRNAFVPLLTEAIESGKLKPQDPDMLYYMMVGVISNTVSYGHVVSKFSSLPECSEKFKQAVLDVVLDIFRY